MKCLKNIVAIIALFAIGSVDAKSMGAGTTTPYRGGTTTPSRYEQPQPTSRTTYEEPRATASQKGNISTEFNNIMNNFEQTMSTISHNHYIQTQSETLPIIEKTYSSIIALLKNNNFTAEDRLSFASLVPNKIQESSDKIKQSEMSEALTQKSVAIQNKQQTLKSTFDAQLRQIINTLKSSKAQGQPVQEEEPTQAVTYQNLINQKLADKETIRIFNTNTSINAKVYTGLSAFIIKLKNNYSTEDFMAAIIFLSNKLIGPGGLAATWSPEDKESLKSEIRKTAGLGTSRTLEEFFNS